MTGKSDRSTRWQLVHDVVVFQVKLGLEAVLDLALIPISLAAAAMDFLAGNWRRPRLFHAVLRLGERCETAINLWGVATKDVERPAGVDAVMHSIEAVIRDPSTGPERVRMLRRWAAMKLAGSDADALRPSGSIDDIPSEQRNSK
jgi:hypothetical protein